MPTNSSSERPTVRVAGVDTALRCTGYGVVERAGRTMSVLDCGIVRNPSNVPVSECLRRLAGGIGQLVEVFQPDAAVIEGGFFHRNARTATVLGMARGVVLAEFAKAGIPAYEYAPRRVKQAVCGYGNASKEQIARLVQQLLSTDVSNVHRDATDALALALCHFQTLERPAGLGFPEPL